MLAEAGEAPAVVEHLLQSEAGSIARVGSWLRDAPPAVVTLAARGSSDHAATFFKYLMELQLGIPVTSIGPSVASVYQRPLRLPSAVHFTISQSGASPDIVALQAAAKAGGARTVAIVNVADSPVAREADITIPLGAGPEKSVAATKSFIASAVALAAITGAAGNGALARALTALPGALAATAEVDLDAARQRLADAHSLYACSRGTGLGIALEAALKCKETAGLHAEAFSTAEVMHGPLRLVQDGFPVLGFVQDDAAFDTSSAAMARLAELGAHTITLSSRPVSGLHLSVPSTGCGLLDPLVALLPAYRLIEAVTRQKGFDPDKPRNLNKVTETL
ncbi:SIS domain-containing protein [Pseudohoeflea coraliihabitans]|uniref:SIS domain-containing protein n=1 Tax=Pseudohoeflea coraliihabitans TaxID=2860393 RepID=A0ABS6WMZ1_9HYPH|nr:SIS domain-containing protein [Pseudohoeflea sp. DP4N28-3]MBW3097038.1 SIS domain-containing protein [Pseudohoeflea sp. DP4N28-3]